MSIDPKTLLEYEGPDRIVHFTEYLKIKEKDRNNSVRFGCGDFPQFNERLDDLQTGELTVISGKTGEGKTLFAESWMSSMLKANHDLKACLFSFEVTPKSLLTKYADSPQMKIYLPLELKTADFHWLLERVWEAAIKENCRLFVFDHLHFLIDMAEKNNMSLNIGKFMRELKWKIAMDLNVSVILIAHQGKDDGRNNRKSDEPSIDNIRDSSFIAQEADNVILVWRRPNFSQDEMNQVNNPLMRSRIEKRLLPNPTSPDNFSDQFAMVQIAKARRSGTFRWKKLFQKAGPWMEEV